jgi:hypothetical protein
LLWFLITQNPREPVYHGKALTLWLQTYDPSSPFDKGSPEWSQTDDAVLHIGSNGMPVLLQMLSASDSELTLQFVRLVQRQRLMKIHFVPAMTQNIEASRAFIVLGDAAKDAVPELIKVFDGNHSFESQAAIEDALSWIGPGAEPALPLLLGAATNVNHKVRANALWALGEIRAEAQICVPVLIHALSDTDSGTRLSAAHALGMFGSDAESAIPALTRLSSPATFWGPMGFDQAMIEAQNALRQINRPVVSSSGERVTESELPNLNPLLIPR